ncbi:MAG TPA: HD domain-containing protein [Thermoanaerobaculia bacterium]|jgi:hypothetical protein|nr:HD domain-containing protein [Thermoanaerobaculia bacterium]
MTRGPVLPPRLVRRGDAPARHVYACRECGSADVSALVEFYGVEIEVAGVGHCDGEHLVCFSCITKARNLFFNAGFVGTKTPLFPFEAEIRDFAALAHGDQRYDSGASPYVVHLSAVRDTVVEFGFGPGYDSLGENYVAAAWLHDVVEDTRVTREDIAERFGGLTQCLVWAVTGEGSCREERNESAYRKMVREPLAIPLKLADRISNTRASKYSSPDKLFPMYLFEYPKFRRRLRDVSLLHAPRCLSMWRELDEISKYEERKEDQT